MARKSAHVAVAVEPLIPLDGKLDKATRKFIEGFRRFGADIAPESTEERGFKSYIDALVKYESAWCYWASMPEKITPRFLAVRREVDRRRSIMFRAYDSWQATAKRTFHVDVEDVRQVVYDALMANADAMPDHYMQLSGLERGREFKTVANGIVSRLQADRVQVSEENMDARYCNDCQEDLA